MGSTMPAIRWLSIYRQEGTVKLANESDTRGHNGHRGIVVVHRQDRTRVEANLNEPFNILVVTNSRRQATHKTTTKKKPKLSLFHLLYFFYCLPKGEEEEGTHRTWTARDAGQNKVVSTKWPNHWPNVSGYQSSCCCCCCCQQMLCEGVASPPCLPAGSGIHVPRERERERKIQGTRRPFLAQAVQ